MAWTYKIKKTTEKTEDTLWVNVDYTNGTKIINVIIPVFQPASKEEVHTAIKNRFQTEKRKYLAENQINVIKPDIDSDVGNIHPSE